MGVDLLPVTLWLGLGRELQLTGHFAERMLDLAQGALSGFRLRNYRGSNLSHAHGQAQAERWLQEGLKASGLRESDLEGMRGSDPRKVALAALLWRHTTVSQGWIAERLHMGSAANVSQLLRREGKARRAGKLPVVVQFELEG